MLPRLMFEAIQKRWEKQNTRAYNQRSYNDMVIVVSSDVYTTPVAFLYVKKLTPDLYITIRSSVSDYVLVYVHEDLTFAQAPNGSPTIRRTRTVFGKIENIMGHYHKGLLHRLNGPASINPISATYFYKGYHVPYELVKDYMTTSDEDMDWFISQVVLSTAQLDVKMNRYLSYEGQLAKAIRILKYGP